MMTLPNSDRAVIDVTKLRDYYLNMEHPRGKHKARVFEAALGISREDSDELKRLILSGVGTAECEPGIADHYGTRFLCDFKITFRGRSAVIRTAWIIKSSEDFPRLTTCYLK